MCLRHVGRWEETRVHRGAGEKGQACTVGPGGSRMPTCQELLAHAPPWGPSARAVAAHAPVQKPPWGVGICSVAECRRRAGSTGAAVTEPVRP